jgi:hypothetical protein
MSWLERGLIEGFKQLPPRARIAVFAIVVAEVAKVVNAELQEPDARVRAGAGASVERG